VMVAQAWAEETAHRKQGHRQGTTTAVASVHGCEGRGRAGARGKSRAGYMGSRDAMQRLGLRKNL
jgi:hypothetical protein